MERVNLAHQRLEVFPVDKMARLAKAEVLDLGFNAFSVLPAAVMPMMTQLVSLDLTGNRLSAVPPSIACLTQLQILHVEKNALTELSLDGAMPALQVLYASQNRLADVSELALRTPQLRTAVLAGNALSLLPRSLQVWALLEWLDASQNQIASVSDDIGSMPTLQTLLLQCNRIAHLPPSVGRLQSLRTLNLADNHLESVPHELCHCRNLRSLTLRGNALTALPSMMDRFSSLEFLDVSNNCLDSLPDALCSLATLRILLVNGNQLTALPQRIGALSGLVMLSATSNALDELPASIGECARLEALYVQLNHIRHLPNTVVSLERLQELLLDGNPLQTPPMSVALAGVHAIKEHLRQMMHRVAPVYRMRLVLVGNNSAGKTSLGRALRGEKMSALSSLKFAFTGKGAREATDGVRVVEWKPEGDLDITLQVYDVGGHDVFDATAHYFYSSHALYLLVFSLDLKLDEILVRVNKWLDVIQSSAAGAWVVLVGTHVDSVKFELRELNSRLVQALERWYSRFPEGAPVVRVRPSRRGALFWAVSSTLSTGIDDLRAGVLHECYQHPLIRLSSPEVCMQVWNKVAALAATHPILPWDEFARAADLGLTPNQLRAAAIHLHHRGLLLYFHYAAQHPPPQASVVAPQSPSHLERAFNAPASPASGPGAGPHGQSAVPAFPGVQHGQTALWATSPARTTFAGGAAPVPNSPVSALTTSLSSGAVSVDGALSPRRSIGASNLSAPGSVRRLSHTALPAESPLRHRRVRSVFAEQILAHDSVLSGVGDGGPPAQLVVLNQQWLADAFASFIGLKAGQLDMVSDRAMKERWSRLSIVESDQVLLLQLLRSLQIVLPTLSHDPSLPGIWFHVPPLLPKAVPSLAVEWLQNPSPALHRWFWLPVWPSAFMCRFLAHLLSFADVHALWHDGALAQLRLGEALVQAVPHSQCGMWLRIAVRGDDRPDARSRASSITHAARASVLPSNMQPQQARVQRQSSRYVRDVSTNLREARSNNPLHSMSVLPAGPSSIVGTPPASSSVRPLFGGGTSGDDAGAMLAAGQQQHVQSAPQPQAAAGAADLSPVAVPVSVPVPTDVGAATVDASTPVLGAGVSLAQAGGVTAQMMLERVPPPPTVSETSALLLERLCGAFWEVVEQWFAGSATCISAHCPCSQCIADRVKDAYTFDVEACAATLSLPDSEQTMVFVCPREGMTSHLMEICPELLPIGRNDAGGSRGRTSSNAQLPLVLAASQALEVRRDTVRQQPA